MKSGDILTAPILRLVPGEKEDADEMMGFANEEYWLLARVIEADGDAPAEDIYTTEDGRTRIHWIQDPKISRGYIALAGENVEEVAELIRSGMSILGLEEIRQRALSATSRADRMRSIYDLALAAPIEHDPGIFEIFGSYLEDADPDVRGAAVLAISYVGWREFLEPLRTRASEDADGSVREDATILIGNLQKYPARSVVAR
ncbi:HEAT repeat domain-containing protein [Sandaracinus amylolyticus]|uniref:HEAT repeat domain-containing protein n=1 Tax=Sandaracinus amylolyticus TaxID=927083 RepID=A0A0F6YPR2_9BACT|nr:HEAT repeat domain-containing protein [Sandaracinus amylolyticus]AKF11738.1 hypothetical protein DB32_008887 [Sandaracinus amylolyticus]